MFEPGSREFVRAVCHVPAAEHSGSEHLSWGQLRSESGIEMLTEWFGAPVDIAVLHPVMHFNANRIHQLRFLCPDKQYGDRTSSKHLIGHTSERPATQS